MSQWGKCPCHSDHVSISQWASARVVVATCPCRSWRIPGAAAARGGGGGGAAARGCRDGCQRQRAGACRCGTPPSHSSIY